MSLKIHSYFVSPVLAAVLSCSLYGCSLTNNVAHAETKRSTDDNAAADSHRHASAVAAEHQHADDDKSAADQHHMEQGMPHQHSSWPAPPVDYADFRSDRWADLSAALRGEEIYADNCMPCHGADGRGSGPAAVGLAHPPADLTYHFLKQPGDGDAYLFWRVSEGGTAEPFVSMDSDMPAFKHMLTEDERWDVLSYVHIYFHLGLADWQGDQTTEQTEKLHEHAHHNHNH